MPILPIELDPNQISQIVNNGMLPADELASLGSNYDEIMNMPMENVNNLPPEMPMEISNAMFQSQDMPNAQIQPVQMPPMQQMQGMFQQPQNPIIEIGQQLGLDPQRAQGLGQMFEGLAQIEDNYRKSQLPMSTYLKMKELEDNAEIKRQSAMVQSMQLESDLNYQRQNLEMRQEELAMKRQELYGDAIKGQRIADILSGGAMSQPVGIPTGVATNAPVTQPDQTLEQLRLLAQTDPEKFSGTYLNALNEKNKPQTEAGRLEQDLQRGLISQEAFDASMSKINSEVNKNEKEQQKNVRAYETFKIGLDNVDEKMSKVVTAPFLGALPAVTAAGQSAQGSVDVMAPILKDLFRTAGEGTFTDKDQELLMDMLPTRSDFPEARRDKINAINDIVRSKLGMAQDTTQPKQRMVFNPTTGEFE